MAMTYECTAGLVSYHVTLDDEVLVVRGPLKETEIALTRILKLGIASAALDRRLVFGPLLGRARADRSVQVGERDAVELPAGLAGLVVLFESPEGKKRDVAIPFNTEDAAAVELIEALTTRDPDHFVGYGNSAAIRSAMGLGKGDMLLGLILTVVIGAVVALLMYIGVLG